MRKFDLITEADARVLPQGESVVLARGGHVTPLAADTLKAEMEALGVRVISTQCDVANTEAAAEMVKQTDRKSVV